MKTLRDQMKTISETVEFRKRSAEQNNPFLKKAFKETWVDPTRGPFAPKFEVDTRALKAHILNKENYYNKIFLQYRKANPAEVKSGFCAGLCLTDFDRLKLVKMKDLNNLDALNNERLFMLLEEARAAEKADAEQVLQKKLNKLTNQKDKFSEAEARRFLPEPIERGANKGKDPFFRRNIDWVGTKQMNDKVGISQYHGDSQVRKAIKKTKK